MRASRTVPDEGGAGAEGACKRGREYSSAALNTSFNSFDDIERTRDDTPGGSDGSAPPPAAAAAVEGDRGFADNTEDGSPAVGGTGPPTEGRKLYVLVSSITSACPPLDTPARTHIHT